MIKLDTTSRHRVHLVLSLTVLVISMSFFSSVNQQSPPENSILIKEVKSIVSNADKPPPVYADWVPTTLPDDWFRQMENNSYKWYSFEMPISAMTSTPRAIYLTHTTRPVSVYINDQQVFKPDSEPSNVARTWEQPQFVTINVDDLANNRVDKKYLVNIKLPRNQSASVWDRSISGLRQIYTVPSNQRILLR